MKVHTTKTNEASINDSPERPVGQIEANPIGFSEETARSIIEELDRHVSSLFVLFHQYQKHHWLVEGPDFRDLHVFFEECYNEIHKDLDSLAERLTTLGGIPTSSPLKQAEKSYLAHESEGYFPAVLMLKRDLKTEQRLITFLRSTVVLATNLGDFSTADLVKETLLHAEDRAHHLDHYLADDKIC